MSIWLDFKAELVIRKDAHISLEKSLKEQFFDGEVIIAKLSKSENDTEYSYNIDCKVMRSVEEFLDDIKEWKNKIGGNLVRNEIVITNGLVFD